MSQSSQRASWAFLSADFGLNNLPLSFDSDHDLNFIGLYHVFSQQGPVVDFPVKCQSSKQRRCLVFGIGIHEHSGVR